MWASQIQYNIQKYDIQVSSTHLISCSCLLQIAKDNLFPAFNTKELVGKPFSFPKNSLVSRYPSLKLPRSPLVIGQGKLLEVVCYWFVHFELHYSVNSKVKFSNSILF